MFFSTSQFHHQDRIDMLAIRDVYRFADPTTCHPAAGSCCHCIPPHGSGPQANSAQRLRAQWRAWDASAVEANGGRNCGRNGHPPVACGEVAPKKSINRWPVGLWYSTNGHLEPNDPFVARDQLDRFAVSHEQPKGVKAKALRHKGSQMSPVLFCESRASAWALRFVHLVR